MLVNFSLKRISWQVWLSLIDFRLTSLADAPEEEEIIAEMLYTLHQWQLKYAYKENNHV